MRPTNNINKVLEALDAAGRLPASQCPPLERRIAQNLTLFELLRGSGLKWSQIVLGLPSWPQKDGTPVSADQVRGAFSRTCRKLRRGVPKREIASGAKTSLQPTRKLSLSPNLPAAALRSAPKAPPDSSLPSALLAQLALTKKLRRL